MFQDDQRDSHSYVVKFPHYYYHTTKYKHTTSLMLSVMHMIVIIVKLRNENFS